MSVRTFRFRLQSHGETVSVSLVIDGDAIATEEATAPFLFDHQPTSRISGVIDQFSKGVGELDDVREVGALLFEGLLQGDVRTLFEKVHGQIEQTRDREDVLRGVIRIETSPDLQHLPWECLYEERRGRFLINHPQYTLIREPGGGAALHRVMPGELPIHMLVVVPGGARLQVHTELHRVRLAVAKLGEDIQLEELHGQVTADALGRKLAERRWDVVHFIGHGEVIDGVPHIRLNDQEPGSDCWLAGEFFTVLFDEQPPRLVVLNCCLGGRESAERTLSGIGGLLFHAGVPSVVAMQYEIPDEIAVQFSAAFYGELLAGRRPGRIDSALTATRRRLSVNQRNYALGFVTPVLYLADNAAQLFPPRQLSDPRVEVAAARTTVPPPAPASELPSELVEALRGRRCVVVVGPDVLNAGAVRSGGPLPMGPRHLAEHLAAEAGFSDVLRRDAAATDSGLDDDLLSRACQVFVNRRERWELLMAVQKAYGDARPTPAVDTIAAWDLAGLVCLYFDGLIPAAINRRGTPARLITAPEETLRGHKGETLVLCLRGHYVDGESLVLTERDHDALFDRLGRMSPAVADALVRKQIGMSALYLGVSPRNRLARRLTSVLRGKKNRPSTCGPVYFASAEADEGVEAYWDEYEVRWLRLGPEKLLQEVSRVFGRGN